MTAVVIGAGAIGLLVAGRLARSAQQVVLLARPAAAGMMRQHGLHIQQAGHLELVENLAVITDPAALEQHDRPPDLAIICVKAYDTPTTLAALEILKPRMILTLQNGLGNEEMLAEHVGAEHVLSGAITTSVEIAMPGRIMVTKIGGIGMSAMAGQVPDVWVERFRAAGFAVRTYPDYRGLKWSKALLNMLGNATAALLDMPVKQVYADRRLVAVERQAFLEALRVMERMGIRPYNLPRYPAAWLAVAMRWLPQAALDLLLRKLVAGGRGGKPPSLLLDLERGSRRSEGEFLYGAIAHAGKSLGVATPVNHMLWETLQAVVTGKTPRDRYRGRPNALLETLAHGTPNATDR